ncbi:MAG: hypothetical protein H6703_12765 [Myxococcales bacterium]|nr:hypothetical protein [Myxococcales bacterium]
MRDAEQEFALAVGDERAAQVDHLEVEDGARRGLELGGALVVDARRAAHAVALHAGVAEAFAGEDVEVDVGDAVVEAVDDDAEAGAGLRRR